jgi:hypothetical protein
LGIHKISINRNSCRIEELDVYASIRAMKGDAGALSAREIEVVSVFLPACDFDFQGLPRLKQDVMGVAERCLQA